jgi:putative redox protein
MAKVTARRREGYTHDVEVGGHRLMLDERESDGGRDEGPSPTRTVAAALAACTAITAEMYADRKGWDVGKLEVEVEMEYGEASVPRSFLVTLRIPGALSDDQVERLKVIAGRCPVHRLLKHEREVTVNDRVERV